MELSSYDILTIFRIIVGYCKSIDYNFQIKSLKACARRMVNLSDRNLAYLSIIALSHQQIPRNIRVCQMKGKLPAELLNMNRTSFFRAFRRSVKANFFTSAGNVKRKRGRRSPHGIDSNLPGPNSNYKQSQAMEDIKRVISIPSARKLIYLLLFESGLLSSHLHNHIIFLFALKMGGPDTIRKVSDLISIPNWKH